MIQLIGMTRHILIGCFVLICLSSLATAQTTADNAKEAQRLTRVAQVAQQQGRNDDAIKAYETIALVAKNSPQIAAAALLGAGNDRLGQLKYAEFVYRILIRDHPDFALAYDGMAVTLSKSGRAREAIPFHEKATSLNPNDPSFYYNFAVSCLVLGDMKRAQEQQQRLHQLDPAMADHLEAVITKRQK